MTTLLSMIFFLLAAVVLGTCLVQGLRRTRELFSLRNIFLAGFTLFQLISAGLVLGTESFGDVTVLDPARTGIVYLALVLAFLILFIWSYRSGWFVRKVAWRSSFPFPAPNPGTLLMLGSLFLVIGFVLRVVIGRNVPVLGILTDILSIGILAGAAGLATWAWTPRLLNPAIAIPAIIIIVGAIGMTVFLTFGRRDVLGVLITIVFAAYHSHWKHQGWLRLGYRAIAVIPIAVIFLAAFSTVRSATVKERDIGQMIQGILEADISGGIAGMATGQFAAANSMWLIENRPESRPYDTFHSMIYAIGNPIPRQFWPGKPEALGHTMVKEAGVWRFSENYTVGPGIIGHIVNDNPWFALVTYAFFFGLMLRFFDEFIAAHPTNPFVLLPVIVGSGDLLGIPRGEVGLFLFRCLCSMAAAWVAMRVCSFLLSRSGTPAVSPAEQEDNAWLESDPAPQNTLSRSDEYRTTETEHVRDYSV